MNQQQISWAALVLETVTIPSDRTMGKLKINQKIGYHCIHILQSTPPSKIKPHQNPLQLWVCFSFPSLKEVPGQLPEDTRKAFFGFNSPELIAIHLAGLVQKAGQNFSLNQG